MEEIVVTAKKKDKGQKPPDDSVCKGIVTGTVSILIGAAALDAIRREEMGFSNYAKTAGRGAKFGARFGPVGVASGAIVLFGTLYVWNRYHQDIYDAIC